MNFLQKLPISFFSIMWAFCILLSSCNEHTSNTEQLQESEESQQPDAVQLATLSTVVQPVDSSSTQKKKLRFFNLDLHVSVIADLKDVFEQQGHEVVNWSISGHTWVFGKEKDQVDIVNEKTWELLDQDMCDRFFERYKDYLNQFDGFIVTHTPAFSLLYEKFHKPIIVVNTSRYENPFTAQPSKWNWLNEYLKKGVDEKKIFIISNNEADREYLKYYTGINSTYIPSLCLYTGGQYTGKTKGFLINTESQVLGERLWDFLANKELIQNQKLSRQYKWQELYDFSGIIHFPYQISTMSLFEQYSANFPLFFPSKVFLKELLSLYPDAILSQLSFFSCKNLEPLSLPGDLNNIKDAKVIDHWIQLADYYNSESFPYIQYFDSFSDLEYLMENLDLQSVSNKMKDFNEQRKERVLSQWEKVLNQVLDSSNK